MLENLKTLQKDIGLKKQNNEQKAKLDLKDKTPLASIAFTKENFNIIAKEAQSMIEENAELKGKLAKMTADFFELDHKLRLLTIENNYLTEQNELLTNSEAESRAKAKAASIRYETMKRQLQEA